MNSAGAESNRACLHTYAPWEGSYVNARVVLISFITLPIVLAGCGSTPSIESTNPMNNTTENSTAATQPTTSNPSDAKSIVDALKAAGMPIGKMEVYTESNDPNKLLGRPGQYTSKVNFVDTRVHEDTSNGIEVLNGGSVEVFANENDAKTRFEYISNIAKQGGMFSEYDFRDGNVILRLSHDLTPSQEKDYETALQKVLNK